MSQVSNKNILYYNPGSVFSNVGVLLLCEKGVQNQFEFKPIQMGIDNISPWYIKLNPKGQVPTLIHQGKPIPDSLAIAGHLDACFGSSPIFSTDDPEVLKVVERWRQVRVLSLLAGKKTSTQDISKTDATLTASRQQILRYMQEHPELVEQYKTRLDVHDDRTKILIDHPTFLLHKSRLDDLFRDTELALKANDGHLLPNKNQSVADVYATGILYWLISKLDKDILKDRPILNSYYLKQASRPSFAKAFIQ